MSLLPTAYGSFSNILVSRLILCVDEIIGDHSVDFDVIFQLLIRYSHTHMRARERERRSSINQIFYKKFINHNFSKVIMIIAL
jgi:hypothetical protein